MNAFDIIYKGGMIEKYFEKLSKTPLRSLMAPLLSYYPYAASKYGQSDDKSVEYELSSNLLNSYLNDLFN